MSQFLFKISAKDTKLQTQLFRFVDVLPSLDTDEEIFQYFNEYLSQANRNFSSSLALASKMIPGFRQIFTAITKSAIQVMAKNFIAGSDLEELRSEIKRLGQLGQDCTVDILGELALSEAESERYLQEYLTLIRALPQSNISVKLSALYSQINPLSFELSKNTIKDRLRLIYREAKLYGSFVNVDLEHFAWKDLTLSTVKELLLEEEFLSWADAGLVIQAYLKSSREDLEELISWAQKRGTPVTVRLVKGAYWDYEKAVAEQNGWDCPVYTVKAATDLNYEILTRILFENHLSIRPAIASHNIRSIANALDIAQELGIAKNKFEFQMLYGMLDPFKKYFVKHGISIRNYLPFGELVPGMSYLVRRLLENTANSGFLRQGFIDKSDREKLLADPKDLLTESIPEQEDVISAFDEFINATNSNFAFTDKRSAMDESLRILEIELKPDRKYPLILNGEHVWTEIFIESINPCKASQILGLVASGDLRHADAAVRAAKQAEDFWQNTGLATRTKILKSIAKFIEQERFRFAALITLESGKPWAESDIEVSEAIDFLNYYSLQAEKLFNTKLLRSMPGEHNENIYLPYGSAAIIAPWNFPLAILCGMSAAALVTGNTVIVKASEQSSIVAYEFTAKLIDLIIKYAGKEAKAVLQYLPGKGSVIGNYLVEHPDINLVAFTGSNAVGKSIALKAAAKAKTQIIAEMGGKNTIIIDESADLDEAIQGVLRSAFAYAGQKCSACSRVIVLSKIYKYFTERLSAATQSLIIGDASSPNTFVPALIDLESFERVKNYIELGKRYGKVLVADLEVPHEGFFVSPTIFTDLSSSSEVAQEEIFGPVLSMHKAYNLEEAVQIANNTKFGLTGALFSRSPKNIEIVSKKFKVGNLYINRPCTGAVVSRQAFGGLKESSIGFKAGGPNYLLQFVQEKTITENTMRRGFIAIES